MAAAALIGLPLVLQLLAVSQYGRLPRDDYYGVVARLCDEQGFLDTPASFYQARINQHRVTLPAVLWRLNVAATGGDNRVTGMFAVGFLAALLALCLRQLPAGWRPADRLLATALLSWGTLGPQHTYNLAKSFGGTHTFLADLLTLGAMSIFLRRDGRRWPLILLLGVAGVLSFSSALMLWPALALACWWLGRPARDLAGVLAGGALATAIFVHGWRASAGDLPSPGVLLDYLAVFLGALPQLGPEVARWLGLAGLLAAGALVACSWRATTAEDPRRKHGVFWLMILAYAAGNGVLAGLGRAAAGGADQALAPRYALFSSLFWLSAAMLAWTGWEAGRRARLCRLATCAVLLPLLGLASRHGLEASTIFRQRADWQQVVEDQLRHDAWDPSLLRLTVTSFPQAVVSDARRSLLERLGHVPWDLPAEIPDRQLDPRLVGEAMDGAFTEIVATANPDIVRVGGWIPKVPGTSPKVPGTPTPKVPGTPEVGTPEVSIGEIVFADASGRQRSKIYIWPHDRLDDRLTWVGIARWHPEWKTWTPFGVDAEGQLRPIKPARFLATRWQELLSERSESPGIARSASEKTSSGDQATAPPDADSATRQ